MGPPLGNPGSLLETAIVIPAYNEALRLPATLQALAEAERNGVVRPLSVTEVIVVDDGSRDDTKGVAQQYGMNLPGFKLISGDKNRGKGHAVRAGLSEAKAPWVLVADADMSAAWDQASRLAHSCLTHSAQIVIGSRGLPESDIKVHQSPIRENLGRFFNVWVRLLTRLPFKDTQCGFKLIHRASVLPFLSRLEINGFAWDVEFLLFGREAGLTIMEVPIVWEHKETSRVHPIWDGSRMLLSLLKITLKHTLGVNARKQIRNPYRLLSLLLLGLLCLGLASVALPEEISHFLYDGDEDDAAISVPGRPNVYIQHDDFAPVAVLIHRTPEARWVPLVPQRVRVPISPPLRTRLTRSPPVH